MTIFYGTILRLILNFNCKAYVKYLLFLFQAVLTVKGGSPYSVKLKKILGVEPKTNIWRL